MPYDLFRTENVANTCNYWGFLGYAVIGKRSIGRALSESNNKASGGSGESGAAAEVSYLPCRLLHPSPCGAKGLRPHGASPDG